MFGLGGECLLLTERWKYVFLCLFGSHLLSPGFVMEGPIGGGKWRHTAPPAAAFPSWFIASSQRNAPKHRPKNPKSPFSDVTLFPPTLTADTDSEEEEEGSLRDDWPAQPPSAPKPRPPSLYSTAARKGSRAAGGPKAAPRSAAAGRPLKPKVAAGRKQPFCLLLREAEAGSSFSDSSEDSFDQGY